MSGEGAIQRNPLIMGIVFVFIGLTIISFVEKAAVQSHEKLADGWGECIKADSKKIDPVNEGKLVFLTGKLEYPDKKLRDELFNYEVKALKLDREVEVYKSLISKRKRVLAATWEKKDFLGSASGSVDIISKQFTIKGIKVGAFKISEDLLDNLKVDKLAEFRKDKPQPEFVLPDRKTEIKHSSISFLKNPDNKKRDNGDVKVTYRKLSPDRVSIVAEQAGDTLVPFKSKSGKLIFKIMPKLLTMKKAIGFSYIELVIQTWFGRALGFLCVIIGANVAAYDIVLLLSFIPFFSIGPTVKAACFRREFLGDRHRPKINGVAYWYATFGGFYLALFAMGKAWIEARPAYSSALKIVGLILIIILLVKKFTSKSRAQ